MVDPTSFEQVFRKFFGEDVRDDLVNADLFRRPDPKRLAELWEALSQHMAKRIEFLEFVPDETRPGGVKARLEAAIEGVASAAEKLKVCRPDEAAACHEEIIRALDSYLMALLDHAASIGPPP
jgi:hypothetical protein